MTEIQSLPPQPPAKIRFDPAARAAETPDYPIPPLREKGRVECIRCHDWLPFDQFESLTDPFCGKCRVAAAEGELAQLRAQQCKSFAKELIAVEAGRKPLEHIAFFLAELMWNFGGMRPFVKEYTDQLKTSFRDRPGAKTNLDQCRSILKLVLDTNKLQHQEDVLDMSDEQLRVKKELALIEMLSDAAGDPHRRQLFLELLRSQSIGIEDIPGIPQYLEAQHAGDDAGPP